MHRKKRKLFCMVVVLILLMFAGCGSKEDKSEETVVLLDEESEKETASEEEAEQKSAKEEETKNQQKTETEMIVVYVCGEVQKEGVVTLPAGSRIYQAIEMAGGVTEEAEASWLNLAEVLTDGVRIYVPGKEEVSEGELAIPEGTGNSTGISEASDGLVNLNQASKEELMTLPGIGEAKAEAILQYRTEHGTFSSIDEIKNISGIKDGVFEKIKDKITV